MGVTGLQLGVEQAFDEVLATLEQKRHAWVIGDVGSGRHSLANKLAEHLGRAEGKAAAVDLLDVNEADAIIGGIFAAAAWLPSTQARNACMTDWGSMHAAVGELAKSADSNFALIATVPR